MSVLKSHQSIIDVDALCFSSTEIDDMIRKSTNLLLTRTLSHCLQYAVKKKNAGLAEVGSFL